jgi:N-methylhydantoinase A
MSAGAVPGPACYGRGGTKATITDANLLLGRLNPGNLLDGAMDIHPELASKAYKRLGDQLGIEPEPAAVSVIRIANSMMSKILRIVSVERGYDPRDFALVAFGGAGPMHVCALAEELEIERVLVPPNPGMFSALGLLTADLFHDYSRPVLSDVTEVDAEYVEALFKEMLEEGKSTLDSEEVSRDHQSYKRTLDMRYRGQGFELNIETEALFTLESISKAVKDFHAKHTEVYGYAEEDEPIEVVNAKLRGIGLLESPRLKTSELSGFTEPRETRQVFFETDESWHDVGVYDRSSLGAEVVGPAIIEQYDSTTVIYPGWRFKPDNLGNLILRRHQR